MLKYWRAACYGEFAYDHMMLMVSSSMHACEWGIWGLWMMMARAFACSFKNKHFLSLFTKRSKVIGAQTMTTSMRVCKKATTTTTTCGWQERYYYFSMPFGSTTAVLGHQQRPETARNASAVSPQSSVVAIEISRPYRSRRTDDSSACLVARFRSLPETHTAYNGLFLSTLWCKLA